MTITAPTNKLNIVKEVLEIIAECKEDKMEHMINMCVSMHLKEHYGYDRAEATTLLIGAELIDELGLIE